jgi:phosphomannomutase
MDQSLAPVFKAYDIRGLSPEQVDGDFAHRFGRVLAEIYHPKRVCVGRDMRSTSSELERALVEGLTEGGADVALIGLCTTPVFNAAMGLANGAYDLGVMVTASHNPGVYNGFKMTDKDVLPIGQGSGMEEIRDRFLSDAPFNESAKRGVVTEDPNAINAYLDKVFSAVDVSAIKPMKIAIDAGNGMAGVVLPELARRLPQIEILPLYWDPDGNFPNHEANPIKSETLADLSALVKKEGCALGVAYDGDCDRVGFVDENGVQIQGDILAAILARAVLAKAQGSRILYDLRSSWSTPEAIREAGGDPAMCRVGHAFIKRRMREENAVFSGELSMHFYFKETWGAESGDLALLEILSMLSSSGRPLSAVVAPYQKYFKTPEINSEVPDADAVLRRIDEAYAGSASSRADIDGIRFEFNVASDGTKGPDAWWFSVRKSNTEPLVRLVLEAVSEPLMAEKRDEVLGLIRR